MSSFDSQFFVGNRQELLKRSGQQIIVIPAHVELQRNGDTGYPFRQDSNFWYLCGIDRPNYVLVISAEETYLIAPVRTNVELIFNGVSEHQAMSKQSGIEHIFEARTGWPKLQKQLQKQTSVGILLPSSIRHWGLTPNPARSRLIKRLRRDHNHLEFIDIRMPLAHMRMVKQAPELQALQQAIDITTQTLQEIFVPDWFKNYHYEYELEAAITAGFRRRGAAGPAFGSIVASGRNATTIHHQKNNSPLKKGELVLMDVGAEVDNYAADISRTLPIGAKFTARQKEVFAAVVEVQAFAQGLLKPGALVRENEQEVENYMGQTLKKLGLIKRITRKSVRHYYPHACSHMLGLDAHDAADYSQPLTANMVLTVEPGIYIPEEGIGVRIEDDILVTANGQQSLSADLPLSPGSPTIGKS